MNDKLPVAIDSTINLLTVVQNRPQQANLMHQLAYGTAIVRFVNLMSERLKGKLSSSLVERCRKLHIPDWVVQIRHDVTHGMLPSFDVILIGVDESLGWLRVVIKTLEMFNFL
ncbi:ribosomal biogenesis protein LAS1L-like [Octopus sinensis]|uniref:Ribosomal biogenesis protein LAS1L-like n=1 Tax=Octopus sinensis TaxID=2607531 RepID=A0A6P7TZ62_9MOLL|nr:ribosomal biogenesis protein LAS1L-like [Octopus sinensis]